jgi:hypothetical protein
VSPRLHEVVPALPDYPGRQSVEAILRPIVEPLSKQYASQTVQRLVGFWLCWHVFGGLDQLVAAGWAERTAYRQKAEFAKVMGVPVEDWMPGALAVLRAAGVVRKPADGVNGQPPPGFPP